MKIKITEYLMYFFGVIYVLNIFGFFFVFPELGEIPTKISAILFIVLSIIVYILACILARKEKNELEKELNAIGIFPYDKDSKTEKKDIKRKNDFKICARCGHRDDHSEYLVLVTCDFCRNNNKFIPKNPIEKTEKKELTCQGCEHNEEFTGICRSKDKCVGYDKFKTNRDGKERVILTSNEQFTDEEMDKIKEEIKTEKKETDEERDHYKHQHEYIEMAKECLEREKMERKRMTDDEIMMFNEEIMAKVNKREVQPLEMEKKEVPADMRETFPEFYNKDGTEKILELEKKTVLADMVDLDKLEKWMKKKEYNCESCKTSEIKCNKCKAGSEYSDGFNEKLPKPKCKKCKFIPKDKSLSNCEKIDCDGNSEFKPIENKPIVEPFIDLWEKNTVTVRCPFCHANYYLAPKAIEEHVQEPIHRELISKVVGKIEEFRVKFEKQDNYMAIEFFEDIMKYKRELEEMSK